jgi:hypothetical protein
MKNLGESGLGWILIGLMVAIGPTSLAFVGTLMIPGLSVPGFSYFPLLLIALPFSMAMAVRRQANRARMQPR